MTAPDEDKTIDCEYEEQFICKGDDKRCMSVIKQERGFERLEDLVRTLEREGEKRRASTLLRLTSTFEVRVSFSSRLDVVLEL